MEERADGHARLAQAVVELAGQEPDGLGLQPVAPLALDLEDVRRARPVRAVVEEHDVRSELPAEIGAHRSSRLAYDGSVLVGRRDVLDRTAVRTRPVRAGTVRRGRRGRGQHPPDALRRRDERRQVREDQDRDHEPRARPGGSRRPSRTATGPRAYAPITRDESPASWSRRAGSRMSSASTSPRARSHGAGTSAAQRSVSTDAQRREDRRRSRDPDEGHQDRLLGGRRVVVSAVGFGLPHRSRAATRSGC